MISEIVVPKGNVRAIEERMFCPGIIGVEFYLVGFGINVDHCTLVLVEFPNVI